MNEHFYTVEDLVLDDSFVAFCLKQNKEHPSHWETVIRDHPGQQAVFAEAENLVWLLHGGLTRAEVNREIENVRRQLQQRNVDQVEETTGPPHQLSADYSITGQGRIRSHRFKRWIPYAAAVMLLFLIGFGWYRYTGKEGGNNTGGPVLASFESPFGQRKTISLPDGSTVILNANSRLSYKQDFNQHNRELELVGDAFFRVAENAELPFVVRTRQVSTTALGTEFYVRSQPAGKDRIGIDLLKGKVKVAAPGKELVLLPGEKAISESTILRKENFETAQLQQWLKGEIVFEQTPVLAAIQQLEDWYNVTISIQKQGLENKAVSGRYRNAPLHDILHVICFTINRQFSVAGNTITIEK